MPIATAATEKVRAALMQLFQDNSAGFLRAQGQVPLPVSAFVPMTTGEPSDDTVCVAWSGKQRDQQLWDLGDAGVFMTINVWGFGANDVLAQQRAIAIETALVACLDQDELDCLNGGQDYYVNGALSQPAVVGDTRCLTEERPDSPNLIWHLALPVLCPVRAARPEFAAVPEDEETP